MTRRFMQIAPLILFFLLTINTAFSQVLDYRLGEVLIRLSDGKDTSTLQRALATSTSYQQANFRFSVVSEALRIWKINFDHSKIHQTQLLLALRNNPLVAQAQFNHFLENRTLPNDPFFSNQWHLYNEGQNGANFGVDLDMPLAWQQTTGGISYTGDTVVICIIDDFFNFQHEDLVDNLWINYQEVPGNNIDDDANGFVDDYFGWNVASETDEIDETNANDWHGTGVAGIAGATGNNEKGISGVCWNIKMMLVSRGSTTADAIAAYTYPYLNRKLYNESQGQSGAFVVATNASWGLNFAFPDDAPLWCAMYDSLGSVGILNSAATVNADYNVDEVGDLPTTCTSPYLITTTSVGSNDIKVEQSGYGANSIDLGAFGSSILSTHQGNSYDFIEGTSAASPQIAGAIGLLHTAPCPSFASFAKSNPATAALHLKNYILQGVEANLSLTGITASGGRLNVYNSLELMMNDCDYSGCFTPYNVEITVIDTNAVSVDWSTVENTVEINLRYRALGAIDWIYISDVTSPMPIADLLTCTVYELQLQSICQNSESAFTAGFNFTTDGCCTAPSDVDLFAGESSIVVNWQAVTAANSYWVKHRLVGTNEWTSHELTESFYLINQLESCQAYEIQLVSNCNNGQINASPIFAATTKGCGHCIDLSYCQAYGANNSDRWINRISIGDWEHYSTLDVSTGYQNFTAENVILTRGGVHTLEIDTDHDFFAPAGYFHIWIDLDQDGIFNEEELILQSTAPEYQVDNILAIPTNCQLGSTRMRIAFSDEIISACNSSSLLGEVEDYCVEVIEANECLPPINFTELTSETQAGINWSGDLLISEYALSYRSLSSNEDWVSIQTFNNHVQLEDLSACTDYIYFISSICNGEASSPSPFQYFRTKGCGICIDAEYCIAQEQNSTQFEWIDNVEIGPTECNSGENSGYLMVPDLSINLEIGQFYQITITPGFANEAYEEYYAVWLDSNGNGQFEAEENITQGYTSSNNPFETIIYIPETAVSGSTRMRISMKYGTALQSACESGFEGETEDYCVNILPNSGIPCEATYFNTAQGLDSTTMFIEWAEIDGASAYRFRYRPKDNGTLFEWSLINTGLNYAVLETAACELQEFQVQAHCANGWSAYSEVVEFNNCDELVPVSEIERISESKFSVFPNPSVGNAILHMQLAKDDPLRVFLYSATGQRYKEFLFADPNVGADQIEIGPLPPGIYFLQVLQNNQSAFFTKLIVQAP